LQGAIGVLAITAFFNPTLVNPFLVVLIIISAGLLLGRIAGLIVDGGYTGYTFTLSVDDILPASDFDPRDSALRPEK
jgi:hypothetical protein